MRQRILKNWNVVRFIRLLMGTGAVIQGLTQREVLITLAGLFLFITALVNYGCCGSSGCPVSYSLHTNRAKDFEKTDYKNDL